VSISHVYVHIIITFHRKQGTPLSLIVNLDVPDEIILSRISDRWVHLPSGRVYNMSYNRPRVEGYDDETGEPLTKRPDDNPVCSPAYLAVLLADACEQEIFARRLTQFYKSTSPLLSYFHSQPSSKLITLTGMTSDEIWPQLDGAVRGLFSKLRERAKMLDGRRKHDLSEAIVAQDTSTRPEDARGQD
jgi:nucleoside-triphosphate--adenylate kinase